MTAGVILAATRDQGHDNTTRMSQRVYPMRHAVNVSHSMSRNVVLKLLQES
jgi:hypothetical protein